MHPVITRELRTALRKSSVLKARFIAAAAGCGVAGFFMLLSYADPRGSWGSSLEVFLFVCGLVAILDASNRMIGMFSEDRSSQNLGLLYLTGMTSIELFTSRLIGSVLVASSQLLALAPVFAIPFLSGGVSHDVFLGSIFSLAVSLMFMTAVAALASTLAEEEGAAMVMALVIAGLQSAITAVPYIMGKNLTGAAPFADHWLWLSPAFGPYTVIVNLQGATMSSFWMSSLFTLISALIYLVLAGSILRRNWNDDPDRGFATLRSIRNWLFQFQSPGHSADRHNVLNESPSQWITDLNRKPPLYGKLFVAGILIVWMAGWAAWPHNWPSTVNFFITAFILISSVNGFEVAASARRFGDERRSGTIELLLTTPLTPEEIVDGHIAAVRMQFRSLRYTVCALCLLMAAGGFFTRTWNVQAVISYTLIWIVLIAWSLGGISHIVSAIWISLNTARSPFSVWRRRGGWQLLWLVYNLHNVTRLLSSRATAAFPSGSTVELCTISLIFVVLSVAAIANRDAAPAQRKTILKHFRTIAQEPIPDPDDPRLKSWNHKDPLPAV